MRRTLACLLLCATTLLGGTTTAGASDPNGVPVCTAAGDQTMPVIVPDGLGGAIIAWHDQRPGTPTGGVCYAQRVNSSGIATWTANGVALGTSGDTNDPVIAPDGGGGAYVAFGGQGTAPRVQYVNAAGAPQWGANGLTLSTATTSAHELSISRDPGGGGDILVVWRQDNGNAGSSDIFGQKVDFSGVLQWNPGGQALEVTTDDEVLPAVVSDGAGGAVVAWINTTSGGVRAQGFKSNGVGAWSRVALSSNANNLPLSIVADGTGGAIVGWGGGGSFLQRVSSAGLREWGNTSTGVLLSSGGNMVSLLAYGGGGAIATWQDYRSGTNFNVYAQAIDAAGGAHWGANGAAICTATQDQKLPQIVSDGGTGSYVTWFDERSASTGSDIYAQHVDATGAGQWTSDGIALCAATGNQEYPTITTDKAGGAFVVWQDHRSGTDYDIYLQRVGPDASTLAVPPATGTAAALAAWPNPFFDRVQISFALPAPAEVHASVVDVAGRLVQDLGSSWLTRGPHQLQWDGATRTGAPAGPGLYFVSVSGTGVALQRPVVRVR